MPVLLKDLTAGQLQACLAPLGVTPRMARHIQAAVLRRNAWPDPLPGLSARVLEAARRETAIPQLALRGVVFMGMGEPLLNYEAVIQAARILSEPCGLAIAGKAITISTAG